MRELFDVKCEAESVEAAAKALEQAARGQSHGAEYVHPDLTRRKGKPRLRKLMHKIASRPPCATKRERRALPAWGLVNGARGGERD